MTAARPSSTCTPAPSRWTPPWTCTISARETPGFSGADLANLVNEGALLSARRGRDTIGLAELEELILRVMAGPERKSRLISDDEQAIIAFHEVGHALVAKALPGCDPVRKVWVISRGMALGMTVQRPREDRYLIRRSEILARMASAMGGRAAEELVFGDVTSGAQNDLEFATGLARRMVTELGMSSLGPISFKAGEQGSAWSDDMARRIDAEAVSLLDEAHQMALAVLEQQQVALRVVAERLRAVETMDGSELDRLLATLEETDGATAADEDDAEEGDVA